MIQNKYSEVIRIPAGKIELEGELVIPPDAKSLVIFSHGSGSSRFSPRNNFVAKILHERGIATFLLDLLTKEEDEVYDNRFNIDLLTERLITATKYLSAFSHKTENFDFGFFGASTGAASAIRAAVALPELIQAVVSRGGRPDLAMIAVPDVKAATLLIVGELDYQVLELNKNVFKALRCTKNIEVVKGATHLFEESGTLEQAALIASDWFSKYLKPVKEKATKIN
jgi:alpha/beta superfamily hydrolase